MFRRNVNAFRKEDKMDYTNIRVQQVLAHSGANNAPAKDIGLEPSRGIHQALCCNATCNNKAIPGPERGHLQSTRFRSKSAGSDQRWAPASLPLFNPSALQRVETSGKPGATARRKRSHLCVGCLLLRGYHTSFGGLFRGYHLF